MRSSGYNNPEFQMEMAEAYEVGCHGCKGNVQKPVSVGKNKTQLRWQCEQNQALWPNLGKDLCMWYRK